MSPGQAQQPQIVAERLKRAAIRWPEPNPQELDHLEDALSRLSAEDCFVVLGETFTRPSSSGGDLQEYAGRLLFRLKPRFPDDVTSTLRLLLLNWDVSVEQLPWYVESVLGADVLESALNGLETQSDQMRRQVETFRFWLRVPAEQRGDS